MILYGEAGTGKSKLINAVRGLIPDECKIGCITASAAYKIGGSTLDSLFGLTTTNNLELSNNQKEKIRERFKKIKVIIIDEFGMLGLFKFRKISSSLEQSLDPSKDFGGISIILAGDFN